MDRSRELKDMKGGGQKQQYNREHYDEIMTDYKRYGMEVCMRWHKLSQATMSRMLRENKQPVTASSGDRALDLAQLANARSLETQRTVGELMRDFEKFQDSVSEDIRTKFLKPLLQLVIQLPRDLEVKEDNRLSLSDLGDLRKLK